MEEWERKEEAERKGEPELADDSPHPIFLLTAIGIALVIFGIMAVIVWNIKKDRPAESQPELVVETVNPTETSGVEETVETIEEEAGNTSGQAKDNAGQESSGETGAAGENGSTAEPATSFEEISQMVTPKEAVNLRTVPSTASNETVVVKVRNGEKLIRTGINRDTGWSRVSYKDLTLYAVSKYLVTEDAGTSQAQTGSETPKPAAEGQDKPAQTPQSQQQTQASSGAGSVVTQYGRSMTFTACDDIVSPKMEVNLRGEPSTSLGNDSIHYRLKYGEQVHRTGYNEDTGWSRVEYEGEVLYAVTSYLFVVEE